MEEYRQRISLAGIFNRWSKLLTSLVLLSVLCTTGIASIRNPKNNSPDELGYVTIFIQQSNEIKQFNFPVARYQRSNFPMKGPFVNFKPWISMFIDQRTSQTIIYSLQQDIYLFPSLINSNKRIYSLAELIHYKYANFIDNWSKQIDPIEIPAYFQQTQLNDQGIPKINPLTGTFKGAIQIQYQNFDIPRFKQSNSCPSNKKRPFCRIPVDSTRNSCRRFSIDKLKMKYLSSKLPTVPMEPQTDVNEDETEIETDENEVEIDETDENEVEIDETEDEEVETESGETNSTASLENCQCQQSILKPSVLFEHGLFLTFYLSNYDDITVKNACRTLFELRDKFRELYSDSSLEVTLGLGYSLTEQWLRQANLPFPKSFIRFETKCGMKNKCMPNTDGDLLIDIRSHRKDLCFELARQVYRYINKKSIRRFENTFAFAYMSSDKTGLAKDFTGFEDGNDNPQGYQARAAAALIGQDDDEQIHVGGSYGLTQKWLHNLNAWEKLEQQQQERIIGRNKGDFSVEAEPKLQTSHVGRVHIKERKKEIEILRKSLPFGDLTVHGLYFIAFASNPIKHEKLLVSMIGNRNGFYDRLMDFSTPVTGNYWFIPSQQLIQTLFFSD